jgi:osmoprotectant transport system ATP-binding protein
VRPHKGVVEYRGQDIRQQDPTKLRREMGYAIQSAGLIPHMTVAQNVSLVPKLLGWDQSRRNRRSEELLELVGLSPGEFSHKYPSPVVDKDYSVMGEVSYETIQKISLQ